MDPTRPSLRHATTAVCVAAACSLLAGCWGIAVGAAAGAGGLYVATHPDEFKDEDWSGVRPQREPVASPVLYRHTVTFARGRFNLTRDQGQDLTEFLSQIGIDYGDEIYLSAAIPEGRSEAEDNWIAARRNEAVAAFLALNSIKARPAAAEFADAPRSGDTVTVVVRRYVVQLPACPDWTGEPGNNHDNQPGSNFGCATAVNLGMMVADPGDLVRGRNPGPADGELLARSVRAYRKGETKPLIRSSTNDVFPNAGGSQPVQGSAVGTAN